MKPDARNSYHLPFWGVLLPMVLLCCLLLVVSSCQKANEKKASSPALVAKHLQEGYNRAVTYQRMYASFVGEAEKARKKSVAALFSVLARSEEIRAMNHAKLLLGRGIQPVPPQPGEVAIGNVKQMLKMAMSSENIQYYDLYPTALKTAITEKDTAAMVQFQVADELDGRHRELLNEAMNQLDRNPKQEYSVCDRCGYIFESAQKTGCPICQRFRAAMGML